MLGDVKPNPLENDLLTANSGIFLRVLSDLMDFKGKRKDKMHVIVGLSCVEIYNDTIRDLFGGKPGDAPPTLRAIMTADDVMLPSLIVKEVTSLQAVFNEIQLATSRRQSRATDSNAASSRSHCLFMIDIMQQPTTAPAPNLALLQQNAASSASSSANKDRPATGSRSTTPAGGKDSAKGGAPTNELGFTGQIINVPGQAEPVYCSKILLADLAGSEKPQKSGVSGAGLAEATAINSSLTALGNVVHSLHEGGFVSYRVASLTRLLKPTFSQPTSRVLLLANVAPTQLTFDETVSTLYFANKVKAMKVHTTNGAESEKLQFDVMESGKIYDSLLGDLHIFATDTGCSPILRRFAPQSYQGKLNVYDGKNAKKPYKAKERIAHLEATGAMAAASDERQQVLAKREQEERNKKENFNHEVRKACDESVLEYRTKANDLWRLLKEAKMEGIESAERELAIQEAVERQVLLIEEELAKTGIMLARYQQQRHLGSANMSANDHEIAGLQQALADLRSKGGITIYKSDEDTLVDKLYAQSAWFHCNGKRFFYALMEMREAQTALLMEKLNVAEIKNWTIKAEAAAIKKETANAKESSGAVKSNNASVSKAPGNVNPSML
eukprot:GILI01012523.1.p1 GENE.GILI01012523.1~~GILI01012523.1.p1  ORF type:complete len:613 (+),score=137.36 GILI01012523.1:236-2074(+)